MYNCEIAYASGMSDYLSNTQLDGKILSQFWSYILMLFEYVLWNLVSDDEYWHAGFDCTKRSKIKPEVSLLALLKVISHGVSFTIYIILRLFPNWTNLFERSSVETCQWSSSIELHQYFLRPMTKNKAQKVTKLHKINIKCLIACMFNGKIAHTHFERNMWEKMKKPMLVVEASCNYNPFFVLWICSCRSTEYFEYLGLESVTWFILMQLLQKWTLSLRLAEDNW